MNLIVLIGFIELVEKESWTEEGTNFMALRQTVLTALLSSPDFDHPDVTPLSNNDVVIDMLDPILHQTGLENTLMDMSLQQFLHGSETPRQLLGRVAFRLPQVLNILMHF